MLRFNQVGKGDANMIFASDLDRTLVYSKRAIEELGEFDKALLKPIEKKEGNWVAFMTEASFFALKELSLNSLFVPVTTRTTDQFNRFIIFKEDIPLKYAITSNGANILFKGEPMIDWSAHILNRMQAESVTQEELLAILKREGFQFDGQMKQAENLFFYFILNSLPPADDRKALNDLAVSYGWRTSIQGRKLYFIPCAISKGTALEFISNREEMEVIAGSGDSILDWDFLKNCQYRFVPAHGELARVSGTSNYTLTKNHGVAAGEEILQQFQKLLHLNV
jgi:hydroxymethylpyrimidine pyrophosphatase-like HAD family hydrolase